MRKGGESSGIPTATTDGAHLTVLPDADPYSAEADRLLEQVRHTPAPGTVLVGGPTAEYVDTTSALVARIPLAATMIVVTMLVLLFAFTGSVVLPLKALVLNMVSLSATLGAIVFIFQEGHLKWLVGDFTAIGTLVAPVPVLMFCLAFGLSMDYEVFLLSRIIEEYRAHGDTNTAVMYGLQRVGPIVTAAALIMSIVCIAMATSQVSFIKMLGVGLTLAILVDATLIRAVLMPAAMRLLGSANWWAPAWTRAFHTRAALGNEACAPASTLPSSLGPGMNEIAMRKIIRKVIEFALALKDGAVVVVFLAGVGPAPSRASKR